MEAVLVTDSHHKYSQNKYVVNGNNTDIKGANDPLRYYETPRIRITYLGLSIQVSV